MEDGAKALATNRAHSDRSMMQPIDWIAMACFPAQSIACWCGTVFSSHAKVIVHDGKMGLITQHPCPACKRQDNAMTCTSKPSK